MMEFRRVCLCVGVGLSFAFMSVTMYLLICEKSKRKSIKYGCQAENTIVEDKTMDFPFLRDRNCIDFIKNSRVMFIMRGLPGSGKSTIAHNLKQVYGEQAVICSADDFRYNEKGQYIWKEEQTEEMHWLCENKAQQVCKQGEAVVIIDNTNILKRRLFRYASIAHNTGYLVVVVEPKTSWKHNVVELTLRNKHSVAEYDMRRMLSKFDPLIAVYYGWFLSRQDSQILRNGMQDILMECLTRIPSFRDSLVNNHQKEQQFCPDPFGNFSRTSRIPLLALAETPHCLHVTTCFYNKRQTPYADKYATSVQVQEALGSVTTLSIIGWTFTPRTVTARVKLNMQQLKLWRNMDADCLEEDHYCDTYATNNDGSTTPMVQKSPSSCANVTIKPRIGRGDTAHITLSFNAGSAPVQGRLDLSEIIHRELTDQRFKEHAVLQGVVRNYGADLWVVYLNRSIEVSALFTGYYGS